MPRRRMMGEGLDLDEDRRVGPNVASRLIGVGATTVQRWIDAGVLPADRTAGGHRRVRVGDLFAYARRNGLAAAGPAGGPRRLLLVDDDRDLLESLSIRIRGLRPDLEVLQAESGFKAGFFVQRFRPSVVIVDIRMPTVSGIEVCRLIKSDPRTSWIRVFGLTASQAESEIEALRAAGAEEVFQKPIEVEALRALLDRVLPVRAARRRETG